MIQNKIKFALEEKGIIFLLLFINLFIRFMYIEGRDIALDEPFTIFWAQSEINEIFQMLKDENNPPLHFFLLHYWIKLFGIGSLSVRFPSLMFSVITPVVLFKIAQENFSRNAGLIAAAIFTLSTIHQFHAHEARGYSAMVLLASTSIYYLFRTGSKHSSNKDFALFLLTNLLLCYTHYLGFILLFTEAVIIACFSNFRKQWKSFLLVSGLFIVLYSPIISILFHRWNVSSSGTWVSEPRLTELYGTINRFLNHKMVFMVLIIIITIESVRIFLDKSRSSYFINIPKNAIILLLLFIIPYFGMFLLSFKSPMFIDRYVLFCSIPLYMGIAIFLEYADRWKIYSFVLLSAMAVFFNPNPDNHRRMKDWILKYSSSKHEGDITILTPEYSKYSFAYHYNPEIFKDFKHLDERLIQDRIYLYNDSWKMQIPMDKGKGVILLEAGNEFVDPTRTIYKYFDVRFDSVTTTFAYRIYKINRFYNR